MSEGISNVDLIRFMKKKFQELMDEIQILKDEIEDLKCVKIYENKLD